MKIIKKLTHVYVYIYKDMYTCIYVYIHNCNYNSYCSQAFLNEGLSLNEYLWCNSSLFTMLSLQILLIYVINACPFLFGFTVTELGNHKPITTTCFTMIISWTTKELVSPVLVLYMLL